MPLPPAPTKRASLLASSKFAANQSEPLKQEKPVAKGKYSDNLDKKSASSLRDVSLDNYQKSSNKNSTTPTTDALPSYQKVVTNTPVQVATSLANAAKTKRANSNGPAKLFVLDTNVLMHDPMCLFRFEEHDIYLPMIVLEELDGHKKGMTEVARNARQTSRSLDALAAAKDADMTQGLRLDTTGHREAKGRLFFQTQVLD
jgi:PhoH-like ATPase